MGALLKRGPRTTSVSPADTLWWHDMETIWIGLFWCLKYSSSFSQTWRFHPPSKGGSTWDTTSSSTDLWCQVEHLNWYPADLRPRNNPCGLENLNGFLSVKLGDSGWYRCNWVSNVFSQLDNWMPGSWTCLGSDPEPRTCGSVHCGSLLVKQAKALVNAWKIKKGSSNHSTEPQSFFGLDGQALAAVLHETCIAELNFSRKDFFDACMDNVTVQAWCCKSLTIWLSGPLQSAGPGQRLGDQRPSDALESGIQQYWSRRHQGGEPGVGSGFRCRSARRWTKTLLRFFRLFGSTAFTLPW